MQFRAMRRADRVEESMAELDQSIKKAEATMAEVKRTAEKAGLKIPEKCEVPPGNWKVIVESARDIPKEASDYCIDRMLSKGVEFRFLNEEKTQIEFRNLPKDYADEFVRNFISLGGKARLQEKQD
jgi:hypothetical protein